MVVLSGVAPDGTTNTVRANANIYANAWGYARAPNKLHVYDAGYIKLREASLTYNFSAETLGKLPFTTASLQSLEEIYGLSIRTSCRS
jgi:hypothetical protein